MDHKPKNKTFRLKADAIRFIDGFSETYGVSKNAVVNLALHDMMKTLDSITQRNPATGAKVAMALGMKAQQFDS